MIKQLLTLGTLLLTLSINAQINAVTEIRKLETIQ